MYPPLTVYLVKTNKDLADLHLSVYSLSKLANVLNCVDPTKCLEHRLTHPAFAHHGWKGELTLDHLGNFISFC